MLSPPNALHLLLTELRPTGPLFAGKEILADGSIKSKPTIKRWRHQRVGFDSIKQLFDYVVKIQYDNAIIIRGVTETTNGIVLRRKHCVREPDGFHDRCAALLPVDIDDIPVGTWTANPRKTVDGIVRRLGGAFTSTSYVAQLTGSHGLVRAPDGRWTGEVGGDVMSLRLFFITERGLSAEEAEAWLSKLRDTRLPEIDASVGRRVQIIYLARPKWHGHNGADPLGDIRPCWLVRRQNERLEVPDDLVTRTRWQQQNTRKIRRVWLGDCSDVVEAVASIGLPLSAGGHGSIYDRLLWAARLLAARHPLNGHDIETHAWNLRDQLAQMVADARERIDANLQPAGAQAARAALEKYLQDDVHRWIAWLFEHGATQAKKVRRASCEQARECSDDGQLPVKRDLLDLLGEDLIDNGDALYQAKDEARARCDAEREEWLKEKQRG